MEEAWDEATEARSGENQDVKRLEVEEVAGVQLRLYTIYYIYIIYILYNIYILYIHHS